MPRPRGGRKPGLVVERAGDQVQATRGLPACGGLGLGRQRGALEGPSLDRQGRLYALAAENGCWGLKPDRRSGVTAPSAHVCRAGLTLWQGLCGRLGAGPAGFPPLLAPGTWSKHISPSSAFAHAVPTRETPCPRL